MTKRDWFAVGLKCAFLAVFLTLFCDAVYYSMGLAVRLGVGDLRGVDMARTFGSLAASLVALIALRFSDVLVARDFPDDGPWISGTRHQVIFLLACRIAGVLYAFFTAATAFNFITSWLEADWTRGSWPRPPEYYVWHLAAWAVQLGLSAYLLFGGKGLARIAFAARTGEVGSVDEGGVILGIGKPREVFSLAARIVGLAFLVTRLPRLVEDLLVLVLPITNEDWKTPATWPRLFWSLVMVALCIYFIAGAKHVVRLVFREAPKEGQNAES